jgi:uncharacterized protein (DUF1778 family)
MKKRQMQDSEEFDLASLFTDEAIEHAPVIRLTHEGGRAFVKALFEESEPNENLKRAAEDYRKWVAGIERE